MFLFRNSGFHTSAIVRQFLFTKATSFFIYLFVSINWHVCVNWHKDKRIFFLAAIYAFALLVTKKINLGSKLNVFHVEFVLVAAVKLRSDLYTAIACLPVSYRAPWLRPQHARIKPEESTLIGLSKGTFKH